MMRHLQGADRLFHPSRFWDEFLRSNLDMIQRFGIRNFKRSVSQNYFNWMVQSPDDPQMRSLLSAWAQDPSPLPLAAEMKGSPAASGINKLVFLQTPAAVRSYTLFVGLLWWLALRDDASGAAATLEEPAVGNPIPLFAEGKRISQDLANSLREYQRLRPTLRLAAGEAKPILAEIGAGYGRLGYVAHRLQPLRYWIFDIPPALAIAEWYLPRTLPGARIFPWRPFTRWSDVAEDALKADFAFFTIDQLALVPDRTIRSFAAISALHEMRHDQIGAYVAEMTRTASSGLYVKNWTSFRNSYDAVDFTSALIRPPEDWQKVFERQDDVHPDFTEILYTRGTLGVPA